MSAVQMLSLEPSYWMVGVTASFLGVKAPVWKSGGLSSSPLSAFNAESWPSWERVYAVPMLQMIVPQIHMMKY